jgi:predicted RecA/RadA family phage recombinase
MSQADFVQQGAAVDYTPVADTPAGTVVVIGELVGITKHDIKANTLGSISVEGVFDVVKASAVVISSGAKVYWDAANSLAVTTATGNKQIGKSVADAGAGATYVRVRLSQ